MTGGVDSLIASISTMSANEDGSTSAGLQGAPNEAALLALMERTNYSMIQENGQRKYGGPPPGWVGQQPPRGCEIFVGKIPRDCYEDELVPIFERIGKIYELRLMMDFSGSNRGYAFVMYTKKYDAQRAVKEMNNYEIRKGRLLGVCPSVDNCRLFVGGIPKNKAKEEILTEMNKVTEGVVDVIVYPSATDKTKNRGFAFVEYESHRSAAMARRKLIPGKIQLWGHQIAVDWAEPEAEVDEEVMQGVKILYVRNLMLSTTEESIEKAFNQAASREGAVERVKKIRDYAFVHFAEREDACQAMQALNGINFDGSVIEVVLAKPVDKNDYVRFTRSRSGCGANGGKVNATLMEDMNGKSAASAMAQDTAALNAYYTQLTLQLSAGAAGAGLVGNPFQRADACLPGVYHSMNTRFGSSGGSARAPFKGGRGRGAAGSHGGRGHYAYRGANRKPVSEVALPSLAHTIAGSSFTPNKLCRTVEEARNYSAEYVLMTLGYPFEGMELPMQLASYQGHPIISTYPTLASGNELGLAYVPSMPFMTTAMLGGHSLPSGMAPGKMPTTGELMYDFGPAAYAIAPPQFQYS